MLGHYLILALVWLPQTRLQAPTPNTVAHVGTAVVTHRNMYLKQPLITHAAFMELLYAWRSAHLAVRQSSEGSFGLGRIEELYDGRESRRRQQHPAQRAVG